MSSANSLTKSDLQYPHIQSMNIIQAIWVALQHLNISLADRTSFSSIAISSRKIFKQASVNYLKKTRPVL